jgi:hypothetical protein
MSIEQAAFGPLGEAQIEPPGLRPVADASKSNGAAPNQDAVERKFIRLRDEWKAQRGHESSTARLAMHPAYQKIIGMGPVVLPLLFRELASKEPDAWFWALRAITEADPVRPEDRGDGAKMTRVWLEWAKQQGYHW